MTVSQQTTDIAKALHTRLADHLAVQSKLGDPARLYDAAPEDPIFPYLTYGDMRSESQGGDGVDRALHKVTLHVWSRYAGRAEVMEVINAVTYAVQDGPLQLLGGASVNSVIPYVDVMRAPDGRTLHGLIRVNIYSQTLGTSS